MRYIEWYRGVRKREVESRKGKGEEMRRRGTYDHFNIFISHMEYTVKCIISSKLVNGR